MKLKVHSIARHLSTITLKQVEEEDNERRAFRIKIDFHVTHMRCHPI